VQEGGRLVGILTEEDFMGLASKLLEAEGQQQNTGDEKKK
jgi:hypothetical protein